MKNRSMATKTSEGGNLTAVRATKTISKKLIATFLMVSMLFCMSGVMANDVEFYDSPNDDNVFSVLTLEEKEINDSLCNELVTLGQSIKYQRSYGDAKSLSVTIQRQCGSGLEKYKNIYMENAHLPIWSYGCTLTSFAMIANYANKPNSSNVESVNAKMGNNACKAGGVGFDYWAAKSSFGFSNVAVADASSTQHMYDFVCGAIMSSKPAIIGFQKPDGGTHFVTAYSYAYLEMQNPPYIGIRDPNGFNNYTSVSQLLSMGWVPNKLVAYTS